MKKGKFYGVKCEKCGTPIDRKKDGIKYYCKDCKERGHGRNKK